MGISINKNNSVEFIKYLKEMYENNKTSDEDI